MDNKKITIIIIAVILVITAVVFGTKLAKRNSQVSPEKMQTAQPAAKTGEAGSSVQSVTSADPDAKALEEDINSVSEEDFSDSSLSDQNVGL